MAPDFSSLINRITAPLKPPAPPRRPESAPTSADAAARRAQMSGDRQTVGGGTARSGMSLGGSAPTPRGRNARDFDRFLMNQYDGADKNACGTTSMSMVLNFWKNKPGEYTHQRVDSEVRRGPDMFSSPKNLIDYARDQGFRSEGKNNSSIDDLKGYLDQGVPVQVLIDPNKDGGDAVLHYVNVVDYEADQDGKITDVVIADPAGGDQETMPVSEFQEKWGSLEFMGAPSGVNNLMLVHLPGENTPVVGKDGVTRNSDDIELPPQAGFLSRALGLQFGAGIAGADVLADVVNEGAETLEEIKDLGGTVVDGAKRVGSWLNPLD